MTTALSKKIVITSRWQLFAMLCTLHFALWLEVDSIWLRPLLLTHFGLFLMWQPLWRGEQELNLGGVVFIVCGAGLITFTEKRKERLGRSPNLVELAQQSPKGAL